MKTLIFEGAGWAGADTSKETDVTNCRIRTRIRNNNGRVIYLEMGGCKFTGKYMPKYAEGLSIATHIDDIFYNDSKWDTRRNSSNELSKLTNTRFEYNKENILKFVNENLNCSFDAMEVFNDCSVRVHDITEPLCNCCNSDYIPFKEIEININVLDTVKPISDYKDRGFAKYNIGYDFLMSISYMNKYINERTSREQQEIKTYNFIAILRWNLNGIITELEVTAKQNFCTMGLSAEDLQSVINEIIKCNITEVL